MAKKNDVTTVSLRMIYAEKDNKNNRVVPFHMPTRDTVLYAPEGSGREHRMSLNEFLERFERLDKEPTVGRNI